MLSEITQTQRGKYCVIPLKRGSWSSQADRDRMLPGPGGKRDLSSRDTEFLLGIMKKL